MDIPDITGAHKGDTVQPGAAHDHIVQFYDSDAFLLAAVCEFLVPGLVNGDAGVVIATEEHRSCSIAALIDAGLDMDAAQASGTYVALDAAETLSKFMVDGSPDPERFAATIGPVLNRAGVGGRPVRTFGEMVALLWAEGNVTAAIELEALWNELADTHEFSLLCAYPMDGFGSDPSNAGFLRVCETHSHALPSERNMHLGRATDRIR